MRPRPSRWFTGQVEVLERVSEHLDPRSSGPGHVTLFGLDGVGKSEIAAVFADRFRRWFTAVEWVRASSQPLLDMGYADIAKRWKLTRGGRDPRDRVRTWLEDCRDCLLVLDDVPDPELPRDYLPDPETSRVLITSRYAAWREFASPVSVEPLRLREAVEFLLARTRQTDVAAAGAVAELLGNLPLALTQAARYCDDNELPLHEYAQMLRDDLEGVLGLGVSDADRRTVAGVWTDSLQEVRRDSPAAHDLLRILSFLGPGRLEQGDLHPVRNLLPPAGGSHDTSAAGLVHRLLGDLGCHSLAEAGRADMISVHRLVQAVVRASMTIQERRRFAELAVMLVAAAFPREVERPEHWPACERLAGHARSAVTHARALGVGRLLEGKLLTRVDRYQTLASG